MRHILAAALCVATLNGRLVAAQDGTPQTFNLQLIDQTKYPMAKCLDGSPGGFYWNAGSGDGASKWIVHTQGGGWCTSAEDCRSRADGVNPFGPQLPSLGGSGRWPAVAQCPQDTAAPVCSTDGGAGGMMSNNATANPQLWNWNHVMINYCDGASFASSLQAPFPVNASYSVYMRGSYILDAALDMLAPLMAASGVTDVVLKGCSAGGLAQYLHADHMVERLRGVLGAAPRIVSAPGAGFFNDLPATFTGQYVFRQEMQWVFTNHNVSDNLNSGCMQYYRSVSTPGNDQTWRCFMAQYNLPFISTPLFISNSMSDLTQVGGILQVGCNPTTPAGSPGACNATQLDAINGLRLAMISNLAPLLSSQRNGAFMPECYIHVIEDDDGAWNGIRVQGQTQAETFWTWYTGANPAGTPGQPQPRVVDGVWGSNPSCAAYTP